GWWRWPWRCATSRWGRSGGRCAGRATGGARAYAARRLPSPKRDRRESESPPACRPSASRWLLLPRTPLDRGRERQHLPVADQGTFDIVLVDDRGRMCRESGRHELREERIQDCCTGITHLRGQLIDVAREPERG